MRAPDVIDSVGKTIARNPHGGLVCVRVRARVLRPPLLSKILGPSEKGNMERYVSMLKESHKKRWRIIKNASIYPKELSFVFCSLAKVAQINVSRIEGRCVNFQTTPPLYVETTRSLPCKVLAKHIVCASYSSQRDFRAAVFCFGSSIS